jgi:hypothetical protein
MGKLSDQEVAVITGYGHWSWLPPQFSILTYIIRGDSMVEAELGGRNPTRRGTKRTATWCNL